MKRLLALVALCVALPAIARDMADPLILVVSEYIYSSVVRHGYDGIDHETFHQMVRVQVAGRRHPGWIHLPEHAMRNTVTQLASYRRTA